MKKQMKLILFLLCSLPLFGQCGSTTPYLGLNLPSHGATGWDTCLNNNSTILDNYLGGGSILSGLKISGLTVSGTGLASNTGSFSGNVSVGGNETVTGNATVTGNVGIVGTLEITAETTINTGIANNGTGFEHERVTTATCNADTRCDTVITWNTAFADANYTPVCSVLDTNYVGTNLGFVLERLAAQSAASVTATYVNQGASNVAAVINCIAVHD